MKNNQKQLQKKIKTICLNQNCGQFIKYPIKYQTEQQLLQVITSLFNSTQKKDKKILTNLIKNSPQILNFINTKLSKYFSKQQLQNMKQEQKCYHLIYNIKQIPLCNHCHKNFARYNVHLNCYASTCSQKCNNKYIKDIEKRLKYGNIGKNDYLIINDLFPHNNFIKTKIGPFCLDFVDQKNKTIYEINQIHHTYKRKIKSDKQKYDYLKNHGWKIYIIFDFYDVSLTNHYIKKICNIVNDHYNNLVTGVSIYYSNNPKILTDTGWSRFNGVLKYQNKQIIAINYKNCDLKCTPNHRIYNQQLQLKSASEFNHTYIKEKQAVFDIINVQKNNRFFVNQNILVHNCLLLDEFAFISPGLQQGFMASVFPVVSSSKTSQIIIVSTPNGMNNEYYKIWNKAKLNMDKNIGWYPIEINWWEVPGRDQKWKAVQMASFNNDQARFQQEYGNSFLGSVTTLINGQIIQKYKKQFKQNNVYSIQLHKDYPSTKVNIFYPPQKNRAYIIGADPSTGSDNDYQALTIWDITNTFDIKMVASFYQNDIPPKIFAYIICKLAMIYNHAYVAMENNGVSFATLDYLFRQFEYDNIIHLGGNPKTSIGIASGGQRKFEACINFKQILQNPIRKITISDGRLIDQMQRFERHNRSGKTPTYYATSGHDDFIMCSIWAFYILKPQLLENYYNINKFIPDKFGQQIPLFVTSTQEVNSDDLQYINQLDNQFKFNNNSKYQISFNELQQNVNKNSQQIQKKFSQYNSKVEEDQNSNLNQKRSLEQPNFEFSGFFS